MKKLTFLVAALFATMLANATSVTLTMKDIAATAGAKDGVSFTTAQNDGLTAPTYNTTTNDLRLYAKNTITITYTENIKSISFAISTKGKYRLASLTADNGTCTVKGDPDFTAVWSGDANTVTITVGATADYGTDGNSKAGQLCFDSFTVSDIDYSFEPTEKTAIDETMTDAKWTDYTSSGFVSVYMENAKFGVDLWVVTTNAAVPVGEFEITDTKEENTVIASIGGNKEYDYPSCVYTEFDEDGYYSAAYYLISGSLKIEQDGENYNITLDAVSYNGSTIKMVYTSDDGSGDSDQDGLEPVYDGYYNSIHGLSGDDLLWAIYKIISVHDSLSYDNVRGDRTKADLHSNGTIWDIYSNCSFSTSDYCNNTNYNTQTECECHNREHILPKSWWGGTQDCRYSDLVNVYPTDNATNQKRSAWCYGNVTSKTWSNSLGTKLGTGKVGGWSGTVFEPINEYKGDVARIYCYMVACYLERKYDLGGKGSVVFNYKNSRCGFTDNGLKWMLEWHRLDPVSSKEKERNTVVLNKQKNRNPFVDFPNLVEYIWGNKKGEKFYVNSAATTPNNNADALTVTTISGLYTENGRIIYAGEFQIFDLLGRNVTRLNGSLNGVYIVKIGEKAQKVVVSGK